MKAFLSIASVALFVSLLNCGADAQVTAILSRVTASPTRICVGNNPKFAFALGRGNKWGGRKALGLGPSDDVYSANMDEGSNAPQPVPGSVSNGNFLYVGNMRVPDNLMCVFQSNMDFMQYDGNGGFVRLTAKSIPATFANVGFIASLWNSTLTNSSSVTLTVVNKITKPMKMFTDTGAVQNVDSSASIDVTVPGDAFTNAPANLNMVAAYMATYGFNANSALSGAVLWQYVPPVPPALGYWNVSYLIYSTVQDPRWAQVQCGATNCTFMHSQFATFVDTNGIGQTITAASADSSTSSLSSSSGCGGPGANFQVGCFRVRNWGNSKRKLLEEDFSASQSSLSSDALQLPRKLGRVQQEATRKSRSLLQDSTCSTCSADASSLGCSRFYCYLAGGVCTCRCY